MPNGVDVAINPCDEFSSNCIIDGLDADAIINGCNDFAIEETAIFVRVVTAVLTGTTLYFLPTAFKSITGGY